MTIAIRPLAESDHSSWTMLFQKYITFYRSRLSPEQYELTWGRLIGDFPVHGLLAEVDGEPVGLAHFLFRPSTWSPTDFCYLEDLFVSPERRGHGVGRALMAELEQIAREKGAPRLYWTTAPDNATARALYDSVAITDRVQYKILLG
jgi:GNAT superfamily N-acetyltransferase